MDIKDRLRNLELKLQAQAGFVSEAVDICRAAIVEIEALQGSGGQKGSLGVDWDSIDICNMDACVSANRDNIGFSRLPPASWPKHRAVVVAAWMVALSKVSEDDFLRVLRRVQNT